MLGKQRSFLESELPEVPELLSKRKLWHHRSRRGFSDQNPIGCSPSKSSTATKRAHNQSIFYSPHPLTHSITPLAAALLLPLSQQLSRVLQLAKCYTAAWSWRRAKQTVLNYHWLVFKNQYILCYYIHTFEYVCNTFLDVVVNCCTWYAFSYQILHFGRFQVWVWKPEKSSVIFGLETGIFKPAFCFLFSIQKFKFGSVLVVVLKHSGSSRFCKEDPRYRSSI